MFLLLFLLFEVIGVTEVIEVIDKCFAACVAALCIVINFVNFDNSERSDNFAHRLDLVGDALVVLDGLAVGVEDGGGSLDFGPHVVGHVLGVVAYVVREDDVVAAFFE